MRIKHGNALKALSTEHIKSHIKNFINVSYNSGGSCVYRNMW